MKILFGIKKFRKIMILVNKQPQFQIDSSSSTFHTLNEVTIAEGSRWETGVEILH